MRQTRGPSPRRVKLARTVRGRVDVPVPARIASHPDVYPPSEDTYLLLRGITLRPGERFLEVGTGSGLVAIEAARIGRVVATDVNPAAVRLARRNAAENGRRIEVVRCDLMSAVRGPFEVVAFDPPYLEGPLADTLEAAWQGGREGSDVALRFLEDFPRVLGPSGRAYLLLSAGNREARSTANRCFRARIVASAPLFFERLDVLELTHIDLR